MIMPAIRKIGNKFLAKPKVVRCDPACRKILLGSLESFSKIHPSIPSAANKCFKPITAFNSIFIVNVTILISAGRRAFDKSAHSIAVRGENNFIELRMSITQ
jgi:hypothetical protein